MDSPEFVDQPPIEVFAKLFSCGVYLVSIRTILARKEFGLTQAEIVLDDNSSGRLVSSHVFLSPLNSPAVQRARRVQGRIDK